MTDVRGVPMGRNLAWIVLFLVVSVWLLGCTSALPQRKEAIREPRIQEEDVIDDRGTRSEQGAQSSGPAVTGPPALPVEEPPAAVDYGKRQPRRIPWRDRKDAE